MASGSNKQHPWFEILHPRPTAKYQVFIFPSAGAAGTFYQTWDKDFPQYEFALVIYPGRASRFSEDLITTMNGYVNQLDKGLVPYITKPCIFIGHSMGSAISFALAKHMVDTKKKADLIQLMVQMGRGPPHIKDPDKSFHDMTNAEIVADLKKMADPSTVAVYDYPEYVQMLIPMLKADSRVADELVPETPLDIPIIVYGGDKEENVKEPFLSRWIELTTARNLFHVRMFPGHHNFHAECGPQVLRCLKEDLISIVEQKQKARK